MRVVLGSRGAPTEPRFLLARVRVTRDGRRRLAATKARDLTSDRRARPQASKGGLTISCRPLWRGPTRLNCGAGIDTSAPRCVDKRHRMRSRLAAGLLVSNRTRTPAQHSPETACRAHDSAGGVYTVVAEYRRPRVGAGRVVENRNRVSQDDGPHRDARLLPNTTGKECRGRPGPEAPASGPKRR